MSADTNYLHSLLDDADESPARQAWTIRAQDKKIRKQAAEIERLRADLEREQLRLSACGVIALSNTPESAAKARQIHDDYKSASCDDVARAVDREMALRAERDDINDRLRSADTESSALRGALIAAMEVVQREWTRVALSDSRAFKIVLRRIAELDAIIAQADAALGVRK